MMNDEKDENVTKQIKKTIHLFLKIKWKQWYPSYKPPKINCMKQRIENEIQRISKEKYEWTWNKNYEIKDETHEKKKKEE